MALPKAIQKQIEEADALVNQINGTTTEEQNIVPTETQEPEPTPINTVEPTEPPTPTTPPKSDDWEQKYRTLQGMMRAEADRHKQQVAELTQSVSTLVAELNQMKTQQTAPAPTQESLITDSDKEAFGTDLVDLIERATRQVANQAAAREAELMNKIANLEAKVGSVGEVAGVTAKEQYFANLTTLVPDWEAINNSDAFVGWLAEIDPVYGEPRQNALDKVFNALDARRTAAIFTAFKQVAGLNKPAPTPSDELRSQVAPTRSRTSPAPTTPQPAKVWTQREIAQYYELKRRGHLDAAEADRIGKEIDLAVAEGRVA